MKFSISASLIALMLVVMMCSGTAVASVKSKEQKKSDVSIYPRGWIDLFSPPYQNCPTIMMAVSCVSKNMCYIPGGENGAGFDVLKFDGQQNGQFTPMNMPNKTMMMMAISVGGTESAPRGAVGGMSFFDSVQYFENSTTLLPAKQPILVVTQDIVSSDDGQHVVVIDQGTNQNLLLYSSDSGHTFRSSIINSLMPTNSTFARYGAIADANTWYVTLGTWPSDNSATDESEEEHRRISERVSVSMNKKTKKVKRQTRNMFTEKKSKKNVGDGTGYTAVVAKTSDAGKTWNNVFYDATTFYLNGIDCVDATTCLAVGEGFDDKPGGHILRLTDDGRFFEPVLFYASNSSGMFSFMSVKYNPSNSKEAWVGGSFQSRSDMKGLFLYTSDGGKTWVEHGQLEFIGEITSLDFSTDGVGFATAMTSFDDSTVLRYDATGPAPTPAPTWLGNFTQKQCSDQHCKVNCTSFSLQQNVCLKLNGGGSAMAQCQGQLLMQHIYPLSDKCTGPAAEEPQPVDKCLVAQSGSFENFCGPAPTEEKVQFLAPDTRVMRKKKFEKKKM